jgi:hypothetical protein
MAVVRILSLLPLMSMSDPRAIEWEEERKRREEEVELGEDEGEGEGDKE